MGLSPLGGWPTDRSEGNKLSPELSSEALSRPIHSLRCLLLPFTGRGRAGRSATASRNQAEFLESQYPPRRRGSPWRCWQALLVTAEG